MKVYKLLHKPTGLYFRPSNGYTNLSKKGRVYKVVPKIEWTKSIRITLILNNKEPVGVNKILADHFNMITEGQEVTQRFETNESDWEIIEIDL